MLNALLLVEDDRGLRGLSLVVDVVDASDDENENDGDDDGCTDGGGKGCHLLLRLGNA